MLDIIFSEAFLAPLPKCNIGGGLCQHSTQVRKTEVVNYGFFTK